MMLAMTPARCGQNASTTPANTCAAPARPRRPTRQQCWYNTSNKDSLTLAMTPVRCTQGHQRNANKMQLLPRLDHRRPKSLRADFRYSNKATSNNVERGNNTSPTTGRNCVMTGQMPVCDADSNAGVPRAATPAQQGQRHPRNKGDHAGATLATTRARCWQ